MDPTRRSILAAVAAGAWAAARAAAQSSAPFHFFTATEAADIAALASEILPSTDGPGATEAGVVYFIDRALTTWDKSKAPDYREGLRLIAGLSKLPVTDQTTKVQTIEKSEFFETVRVHTLLGFLGDPSYGGNRDKVGWAHIGFDDRHSWTPPFGHYDAEAE